jgi:hypothetical protein
VNEWDQIVSETLAEAATAIARTPDQTDVGELAHLKPAFTAALRDRYGERITHEAKVPLLPDWTPRPSGVDVVISRTATAGPQVGVELKGYHLDQTLWDIFKMASLRRMPGVEAVYVVAVATASKFAGEADVAALFRSPLAEAQIWNTLSFFVDWPKAWCDLLDGGAARPTGVPATLSLQVACAHEIPAFPGWQVRALRVENPPDFHWLTFNQSGWPSGPTTQ